MWAQAVGHKVGKNMSVVLAGSPVLLLWHSLVQHLRPETVLEDYPDCGELGLRHSPQCFWDCASWETNLRWRDSKRRPVNYRWPRLPPDQSCYQDCVARGSPGTLPEGAASPVEVEEYPWLCSLRGVGLMDDNVMGTHRCGVTLLSGEPTYQSSDLKTVVLCNQRLHAQP